jgi:hypothetical protein
VIEGSVTQHFDEVSGMDPWVVGLSAWGLSSSSMVSNISSESCSIPKE